MKPGILVLLALVNTAIVIAVVQFSVARKNVVLENGRTVYLELLPRDPRSLMQGDYMVLRLAISREASEFAEKHPDPAPTRGSLILSLNDRAVGSVVGLEDGEASEQPGQPIRYRKTRRGYRFGLESFFFEEGDAAAYERARFAEVRISQNGRSILVGLADESLEPIRP